MTEQEIEDGIVALRAELATQQLGWLQCSCRNQIALLSALEKPENTLGFENTVAMRAYVVRADAVGKTIVETGQALRDLVDGDANSLAPWT